MITDNTKRFSDRVANYVTYRPGYPNEIIPFLEKTTGLTADSNIADMGSGTGKSAELFLDYGYAVTGVEPNHEMRRAAEDLFQQQPLFKSIDGTAEATTLEEDSYSHIIAGQAFHWFNPPLAKKEFQRILAPGGWVVLIWNERDVRSPFLADYEVFLHEHAVKYAEVVHRNIDEQVLRTFYEPFPYHVEHFHNHQLFDFEGILGRYLSSSYAYKEDDEKFEKAKKALHLLFEKHEHNGQIKMEYQTNMYYGRLK
ncbi:MAG: class I SAM-dependent methyltransferase [Bacteroidota bacterium]